MTERQTQTIEVPHLGGSRMGYRMGAPYDGSKPTLVMVNSFSTSADLYTPQFEDAALSGMANLLAVELFGHGATRSPSDHFTYWDTALATLQVMDALKITQAFVLGTSQGGWVAARMALLEPARVNGIIPLGTSMDRESQRSRDAGCWDGDAACSPVIEQLSEPVGEDWTVPGDFTDFILSAGIGGPRSEDERRHWHAVHRQNYAGDAGRRRLRMSAINLRDRDGLHGRLSDVTCPVLWMHGTADQVYSVANARHEISLFTSAKDAQVQVVEGGQHFLSASHPQAVNAATAEFIGTWA